MSITVPCSYTGVDPSRAYVYPVCGGWGEATTAEIADLITIASTQDIADARSAWEAYLFGAVGEPEAGADDITLGHTDARFASVGAAVIDRYTYEMPLGATSLCYLLRHDPRASRLLIYNHGHGATPGFASASDALITHGRWYAKGFDVLACAMPSLGDNTPPTHDSVSLTGHDLYWDAEEDGAIDWSPCRWFVEPIVRALHDLAPLYSEVWMSGLSGGGWTTHVCAAYDERIAYSIPVAGSQPWYVRGEVPSSGDRGDYEQQVKGLLDRANYLDMYIMACSGGRRQTQVLNRFDLCCFKQSPTYAEIVRERAREAAGGDWSLMWDASHGRHAISMVALATIFAREGLGAV